MEGFDLVLGPSILYTMTTSVLAPGEAGVVDRPHRDLDASRPDGIALAALVMVDGFTDRNGATEFLLGTHRGAGTEHGADRFVLFGEAGDVCYFDPKGLHWSHLNRADRPRRALLLLMVQPWMKQRFDVAQMIDPRLVEAASPSVRSRLGIDALPPGSVDEFNARRRRRPWTSVARGPAPRPRRLR